MKNKTGIRMLAGLLTTLQVTAAAGQTVEELQGKYPDDYAVFTRRNTKVELYVENGEVRARQKEQVRMQVLNDKANGMYNYYVVFHGNYRELKKLSASTQIQEGNRTRTLQVQDMKVNSSIDRGIFYDDEKQTEFYLPHLNRGAVAEVSSDFYNKDARVLTPFYFSSYLPALESTVTISFPKQVKLRYLLRNADSAQVRVQEDRSGGTHELTLTMVNQRRKNSSGDGPRQSYYEPHAIFLVESVENGGQRKSLLNNVDDLYQFNYEQLRKTDLTGDPSLKPLADSLTQGLKTEEEKARRIYRWVQDHIKYVAFEDGDNGVVPTAAKQVCDKRYGDCKGMSHLLVSLLRHAGLPAQHVWIGTNDIPYDYTDVPSPLTDNHMIAALRQGSSWTFLDATDPHNIFGMPTPSIQNKQALIELGQEKYDLVRVPVMDAGSNTTVDSTWITLSDNGTDIEGHMKIRYEGYMGTDFLNGFAHKDSAAKRDFARYKMAKASNRFRMVDYDIAFPDDSRRNAELTGRFQVPAYSKVAGNELFINLQLEKLFTGNVVDIAKRQVPMQMPYTYEIRQHHILNIPAGYKVTYLPGPAQADSKLLDFAIDYKQQNNKIICTQIIKSKFLLTSLDDFASWNEVLRKLHKAYKEQVVLTRS